MDLDLVGSGAKNQCGQLEGEPFFSRAGRAAEKTGVGKTPGCPGVAESLKRSFLGECHAG
jgi:hypothetical protein